MDFRGEKTLPKKDEYEDEGTWIWLSMACEIPVTISALCGAKNTEDCKSTSR